MWQHPVVLINVELDQSPRGGRRGSPEFQDFFLEFGFIQVRHVKADYDRWCCAEPPTGRRARDAEIRGDGDVPGALDEISKPMIVAPLLAFS